jgi:hypothetical protein
MCHAEVSREKQRDPTLTILWWILALDVGGAPQKIGPEALSFLHFDEDDEAPGADVLFPHGYSQIFEHPAINPATLLELRLGAEAVQVTTNTSGGGGSSTIRVSTAAGDVVDADYCVCTLPLGVLKAGKCTFVPQLPEWKVRSIEALGVSLLNKVVLRFERPFWPVTAATARKWLESNHHPQASGCPHFELSLGRAKLRGVARCLLSPTAY